MENYVAFPGLGLYLNIDRVAFKIGSINIYWYGIIIALGIIFGVIIALHSAQKNEISRDSVYDIVLYGIPSAIICARLYYCIFEYKNYINNPMKIFAIRDGGIAIYGAIIGAAIAAFTYCKLKNLNWKNVFDSCILGVITGQCIGRWGNFINKEAFGYETNLPWRMEIFSNNEFLSVHPTFLYESIWNFIGIFILSYINNHKKISGQTFYAYLIWYGTGRAIIEGLRTDSLYLGPFRISQIIGIVTALIGIILIFITNKRTDNV